MICKKGLPVTCSGNKTTNVFFFSSNIGWKWPKVKNENTNENKTANNKLFVYNDKQDLLLRKMYVGPACLAKVEKQRKAFIFIQAASIPVMYILTERRLLLVQVL